MGLDAMTVAEQALATRGALTTAQKKKFRKADPERNRSERTQERVLTTTKSGHGGVFYKAGFYMTDDVSKTIMRTTKWVKAESRSDKKVPSDRLRFAAGGQKLFKGAGKKRWATYELSYGSTPTRTTQDMAKKDMQKHLSPVLKKADIRLAKQKVKEARKVCIAKKKVYDLEAPNKDSTGCRPRKRAARKTK